MKSNEKRNDNASIISPIGGLIISARPRQWTKNLFVFAALAFSQNLMNWPMVIENIVAFFLFCAVSASVYLFNDVVDFEQDRCHPIKSKRPIPSGRVSRSLAILVASCLALASLVAALAAERASFFGSGSTAILAAYLAMNILYSRWLKHVVILDVLLIAIGFVLRAVGGALVIEVHISGWLVLCTILISLFLALSKRRHELIMLNQGAVNHRQILKEYSPYVLDQMISVVTASTLMAYALYTMSPEATNRVGSRMLYTIPFVIYGIFRYLYLVHRHEKGGDPAELIISDRPMLINILLWVVCVVIILLEIV